MSHFFGRRHESTRFSEENCDILCYYHHQHFTENPNEYVVWKKKKLGDRRFKLLTLAVNTYCKRDDKNVMIYLKELEKEYAKKGV